MMRSGPSKGAERAVGLLIPPACREEVLGDLHERYMGPSRYFADALTTVPLVILARIRRTTDASVALMEALVLYLAFVGAAKYRDDTLLESPWGLARLAIPSAVTLLFLALHDAYAGPGRRSTLNGPVFAVDLVAWCLRG